MSPKAKRVAKWIGYPVIYLFLLLLFVRLLLPFEQARNLVESRLNSGLASNGMRVEIGELDGHWLTGLELKDVTITETGEAEEEGEAPPVYVSKIEQLEASVSLFSLLGGGKSVSFSGQTFGGHLSGEFSETGESRKLSLELEDVDISALPKLDAATGLPREGRLTGTVELELPEGKVAGASGDVDLNIERFKLADGETKVGGMLALPTIDAGMLALKANAVNGNLVIQELEVKGKDVQASVTGKIKLRDPIQRSLAELRLKFNFADGYRDRNDVTKGMLGDSEGTVTGLMDLDPKVKRAKQSDGSYAWRLAGPFSHLRFTPATQRSGRGDAK